ncbi:M20/M25/M40 family metallo-hydrolase [uncultured Hyphomonas sp.]|uniref:M20/M25/M40 family metallo-hydrolase n=1 Tax=uncultured Hyphomonas sp. TaxID=225298 RepID=UPI002AAB37A7|nr:M20/M25/M40 family metallo-hydrolase [uncultured Hyphomonas sp.]
MKKHVWTAAAGLMAFLVLGLFWYLNTPPQRPEVTVELPQGEYVDAGELLHLTEVLSNDALQGRAIGTPGNEAARGFLRKRFETLRLTRIGESYEHSFTVLPEPGAQDAAPIQGTNLIGVIEGKAPGEGRMLAITAHFDHLGVIDGEIYNGADDNASGAAALVAVAAWFTEYKPEHDILFALVDGEEAGALGSRDLVRSGNIDMDRIALNLNFDMVSRSDVNELYVSGTYHSPGLVPFVEHLATKAHVNLLMGHDRPEQGPDDWTMLSDHVAFFEAGVPFLYFGVEDYEDYHTPTDEYDRIPADFFVRSADTLVMTAIAADKELDTLDLSRLNAPEATGSE